MNKQLPEMPNIGGDAFAPVMPKWFTNLLRLISIAFALAVTWFSIHDWEKMPVWVQGLVCVLVPAFFFSAFHAKGWALYSSVPFFLADHRGMYFKHKHALTTHLSKHAEVKNNRKNIGCLSFGKTSQISGFLKYHHVIILLIVQC